MTGGDVLAAAFWVLSGGGLLILIWLFTIMVAVLAGIGLGRRDAFREIEAGRSAVWAAMQAAHERAATGPIDELVPPQREGS